MAELGADARATAISVPRTAPQAWQNDRNTRAVTRVSSCAMMAYMRTLFFALVLTTAASAFAQSPSPQMPPDYATVLQTLGRQGDYKDNVLKVNIPRSDLKVTVDGVATPTPFGFGGWIAGRPRHGRDDGRSRVD